jgi:hypothetical protein
MSPAQILQLDTNTTAIADNITFLQQWQDYAATGPSTAINVNTTASKIYVSGSATDATEVTVENGTYNISFSSMYQLTDGTCSCTEDLATLVTNLDAQTYTAHGAEFGGQTLTTGYYNNAGATTHTGVLTLNAENNANAVFVFRSGGAHAVASGATTVLQNLAESCNIFWLTTGALSFATLSEVKGNYVTRTAAVTGAGTHTLEGRILLDTVTANAITLTNFVATLPTTVSATYPIGDLTSYVIYNRVGNISCTSYSPSAGPYDIGTAAGVISGFGSPYDGTYPAGTPPIRIGIAFYNAGVIIPVSDMDIQSDVIIAYQHVCMSTNVVVTGGPSVISVGVRGYSVFGGIIFANRTLLLMPLKPH